MVICPSCGAENPEGFAFCGRCGSPLAHPGREVRKHVTVLFCDLTGSTALGEELDPEALRMRMRRYYEECRAILERHGGTVEKFIGDAVMAVFGMPQAHEDDALRAVRAAVELKAAVAAMGLDARIGVNSGEVVAGEGDSLVTGDAVNVAARLEQHADPGEILIGPQTQQLTRDAVDVEPVELELKGKSAPVAAYRLLHADLESAGLLRRLAAPLVGRARALARLHDDFERAVSQGSSQLFTLLGPPGVGKSRLVEEFVGETRAQAQIVRGRCLHYGDGITYWPLVEVLLQLDADAESVVDLPSPTEAAVATRKLLETHALKRPLVVVWDDIQWGEPAFLDLVEHIADWSRVAPILLLCVARPELLELRPTWGGGKANATSLLLEPLDADETSTLIDNLLAGADLNATAKERIVDASGGNPLFVEEMLLMLDDARDADVSVPPTIHALLQARLDQLATDERSVIERGSIEGEVFHRSPVAELAPETVRTSLDTHLAKLIRTELIRPEAPTMPGDDAFRFRHLLIRDAAYDSLPKETRADLHERFALWLDEHVELVEQDEIVGYHLERAVLYRRELGHDDAALAGQAARRLGDAGVAASARGDNNAVVNLLDRATSLLPPGDASRLDLAADLVRALVDIGRFTDAQAFVDELAEGGERARAYAETLAPLVSHLSGTASPDQEVWRSDEAVETFRKLDDSRGLALAYLIHGHFEWTACRAAAAAEKYRAVLPHARRAQRPALAAEALTHLCATVSFGPTHVDEAEAELRSLAAQATGSGVQAAVDRALGRLTATRGDFDAARELFRSGREPLLEAGLVITHAATCLGIGFVEEHAGEHDEAIRVLREGYDRLTELGEHAYASTVAADLAYNSLALGHDVEAGRWVATARELCPPGDVATLATADLVDGLLSVRKGRHDDAERLVRRGLEQAEKTDFWEMRGMAYEAWAKVLAARGRGEEAGVALTKALSEYEGKGAGVAAAGVRGLLAEL